MNSRVPPGLVRPPRRGHVAWSSWRSCAGSAATHRRGFQSACATSRTGTSPKTCHGEPGSLLNRTAQNSLPAAKSPALSLRNSHPVAAAASLTARLPES
eukprot:355233-Alexandrium_andersonii.AAC.1